MVMETTIRTDVTVDELRILGTQLQTLANDVHLSIKCTIKNERLIVLGQHPGDAIIRPTTVLCQLERTIQSLQLQFTHQVRLYLRVTGQKHPYAHHRFSLPSRSPKYSTATAGESGSLDTSHGSVLAQSATVDPIEARSYSDWRCAITPATQSAVPVSPVFSTSSALPPRHIPPVNDAVLSGKPVIEDESPWVVGDEELTSLVQQLTLSRASGLSPTCLRQEERPHFNGADTQLNGADTQQSNHPGSEKGASRPNRFTDHAVLNHRLIPNATQSVLPDINESDQESDQPLALPAAGMTTSQSFQDLTYDTSQWLKELSTLFRAKEDTGLQGPKTPAMAYAEEGQYRRRAIATASLVTLSVAVGLYGATRPCVVDYCDALDEATALGEKSTRLMQQAQTWTDIELTLEPLNQAIETLEPIPMWSSRRPIVRQQQQVYDHQLEQLSRLIVVEQTIQQADQIAHQAVYTPEDLETVRSLWVSAIETLDSIPPDSPLYDFARSHLTTAHSSLTQAQQQLDAEDTAAAILATAKEAAQLAQARQGIAQTLENWQFARVTWIVALNRLSQVPANTLAAMEAEQLQSFYQTALDRVNVQVEREKAIATALSQAANQAELAVTAEKRHDWTRAIADWTSALHYVQTIGSKDDIAMKVEAIKTQYQTSLANAQDQLAAQSQIEGALKQSCIGELQLCHIVSIGQPIKVQLDAAYLDAINTARDNTNYNLKAVITDHQLMVRQSLDRIADSFDVQIEVYNPEGGLLERHIPNGNI